MAEMEPASDELVAEIERGLAGVTPGPWVNRGRAGATKPIAVGAGPAGQSRFRLFSVYHPMGASSYETWANAEHLARMSPDNLAAILARLRKAERERDELREYARAATIALTEDIIGGGSECFSGKIGEMYKADIPFCVARFRERQDRLYHRITSAARATQGGENG